MHATMDTYGSPGQYLNACLGMGLANPEKDDIDKSVVLQDENAAWLWATFPEADEIYYHHDSLMPPVKEEDMAHTTPLCLHVASLGLAGEASLKPSPGHKLVEELVDLILVNGFETASEPLRASQPDALNQKGLAILWPVLQGKMPLETFSIGCIKGLARTQVLHMILMWAKKERVDLVYVAPKIFTSVCQGIFAHYNPQDSKMEEALANMKISCSGSIRRAPNVLTVTKMIRELTLTAALTDYQIFTRTWNQRAARGFQIVGQRATSLKLHFENVTPELSLIMLSHVQKFGYENSVWSDDNQSSKKIYPGHNFHAKSKSWAPRIKVVKESCGMMVKYEQCRHEKTPSKCARNHPREKWSSQRRRQQHVGIWARSCNLKCPSQMILSGPEPNNNKNNNE